MAVGAVLSPFKAVYDTLVLAISRAVPMVRGIRIVESSSQSFHAAERAKRGACPGRLGYFEFGLSKRQRTLVQGVPGPEPHRGRAALKGTGRWPKGAKQP